MLPKETVDDPSLHAFKIRMDWVLDSLIWLLATRSMAGGLEVGDLQSPLQPKPFYDSVIL